MHIITSKGKKRASSLLQKILSGRHQEKLQVEEAAYKVNSILSRKKKTNEKQVLETKDL